MLGREFWQASDAWDDAVSLPREAIICRLCEEPFETEDPHTPCVLPYFHTSCRHRLVGEASGGAEGADGDRGRITRARRLKL